MQAESTYAQPPAVGRYNINHNEVPQLIPQPIPQPIRGERRQAMAVDTHTKVVRWTHAGRPDIELWVGIDGEVVDFGGLPKRSIHASE